MGAGGMTGSVGALLGFGAKKTKYVLRLILPPACDIYSFAFRPQMASGSAGGAGGMFRKRNRA